MLRGYDIDGVLTAGIQPIAPAVAISGRCLPGYDDFVKNIAQHFPVYISGIPVRWMHTTPHTSKP